jgi:hypothetical protein
MKVLIFDTGPIISLATNNLLWILKKLKAEFRGEFYIPSTVKQEIIDKPLDSKRFKYEAMQVMKEVKDTTLSIYDNEQLRNKTLELLSLANNIYYAHNRNIKIVQYADMEVLASALLLNASAVVIDERTTRTLVESPDRVKSILEHKLHLKINVNKENLDKLTSSIRNIRVIRSIELVIMGYEKGFFKEYIPNIQNPQKNLLDGLLWGVKLNGCSVTAEEIEKVIGFEAK